MFPSFLLPLFLLILLFFFFHSSFPSTSIVTPIFLFIVFGTFFFLFFSSSCSSYNSFSHAAHLYFRLQLFPSSFPSPFFYVHLFCIPLATKNGVDNKYRKSNVNIHIVLMEQNDIQRLVCHSVHFFIFLTLSSLGNIKTCKCIASVCWINCHPRVFFWLFRQRHRRRQCTHTSSWVYTVMGSLSMSFDDGYLSALLVWNKHHHAKIFPSVIIITSTTPPMEGFEI